MTRRRWILLLVSAACVVVFAFVYLSKASTGVAPTFAAVRAAYQPTDSVLLDRNGIALQSLRLDFTRRRLDWVPLRDVPQALQDAVIRSEDRRFASHGGVDWMAVGGAVRDRILGRARRGASTLDMQLAALLDPSLNVTGRRSLSLKWRQMRLAWALNDAWTKDQVLEAYLNLVSFRGEAQGIAAAAAQLFGKAVPQLNPDEAWVLAALLPSPGASPQVVATRACARAQAAADECSRLGMLAAGALARKPALELSLQQAPHLARRLLREPGSHVTSTLDARVQRLAQTALDTQLQALHAESVRDGAAVVVDNASGNVLAYVGSAGDRSRAAAVDGAAALRQAGSTLKPFLYSLALEHRWLTAASLLDDSPVALEAGNGLYLPQNYEHDYKGLVSVRTALAGSLNIPAVRTLVLVGVENFRERLHALGYVGGLTEPGEYYGYSLALGSVEVSLLEQANAFRSLQQGGRWSPLRLRSDDPATEPRQLIDPRAAFIVTDILADRGARAVTFDLDGPLSTPYWSAVKTGTSKNLRDNWCVGFNGRYTVAVWVGNFEGDPMRTVSGITGAAPAWRSIMDALAAPADAAPTVPAGLERVAVQFRSGNEASRSEWFYAGTASNQVNAVSTSEARARIASPAEGSLIALDPDIPFDRQRVAIRIEPASSPVQLLLDGKLLRLQDGAALWPPVGGTHQLVLKDAAGAQLDERRFEVRAPRS
jgi:penicillin-binding protein 1C